MSISIEQNGLIGSERVGVHTYNAHIHTRERVGVRTYNAHIHTRERVDVRKNAKEEKEGKGN